jgi:predicted glycosyltransferase
MEPFVVNDKFGRKIKLTKERIWHIVRRPEMENEENNIKQTLNDPDEVVESFKSKTVIVFNKNYPEKELNEKYLMVAVKILNKHGFILTSYRSGRPKGGNVIWKKK